MQPALIFDIETEALPETQLIDLMPPFDPSEVKTGNIKDPQKIAEKIAEAERNHRQNFIESAALSPLTARVLAIGVMPEFDQPFIIADEDETKVLAQFWSLRQVPRPPLLVGFNSNKFDLPFLIRRSWKHRILPPENLRRGRYWSDDCLDLREFWQLGDREAKGSLDTICKSLGLGAKNGEGREFSRLWREQRSLAEAYLFNDLELTSKLFFLLCGRS